VDTDNPDLTPRDFVFIFSLLGLAVALAAWLWTIA
jgi:hypothetical protein